MHASSLAPARGARCCWSRPCLPATAQDMASFEKNLTVHKLKNGLTVMIYRRPVAPVFSFFTYVDVGAAQEVPGSRAWRTCSSTWRSRGRASSAPRTSPPRRSRSPRWTPPTTPTTRERLKPGGPTRAKLDALKKALQGRPGGGRHSSSRRTSSARSSIARAASA